MALNQKHDVCLVSPVPLLDDFAADLATVLTEPIGTEVELHAGLHRPGRLASFAPRTRRGLYVGMQTEHMLDVTGRPMWKRHLLETIQQQAASFDLVLDLSEGNRPIYEDLPAEVRSRIHFGPHIFPASAPPIAMAADGPTLFFGGTNRRRMRNLQRLRQDGVKVHEVPTNTFGAALRAEMTKASSVLNLHFAEGIYTEAPRILKAMLAGLPVLSEELAAPFVADLHYLSVPQANKATKERLAEIYANMCCLLSTEFSLLGFLRRVAMDQVVSK